MSRTGRPDFDAMVKISSVPADEPLFILRAQDPAAAETVRAWCTIAKVHGVPSAVLEQALAQADAMDLWQTKKTPRADHLNEHERKQLEYEHDRRAWNASEPTPSIQTAMAERRGFARCQPVIRQLVTALKGAMLSVEWRIGLHDQPDDPFEEENAALRSFRDLIAKPALQAAEDLHD